MAPPVRRERLVSRLARLTVTHAHWLSWVLFLAANVLFFALPLFSKPVFFDEKALLAGSASPQIQECSSCKRAADDFLDWCTRTAGSSAGGDAWFRGLQDLMARVLGISPSVQNFNASVQEGELGCLNVHAVVRTARGDGKEGIVLVTPLGKPRGFGDTPEAMCVALSVGAALTRHLSQAKWLSKDFIWLVSDSRCGPEESVRRWLTRYHFQDTGGRDAFRRGGLLGQTIVLETEDGVSDELEYSIVNSGGQLSKMELYWLVKSAAEDLLGAKSRFDAGAFSSFCRRTASSIKGTEVWRTMLCSMLIQATGVGAGPHAPFREWSIDAVTVRAPSRLAQARGDSRLTAVALSRVMESAVRSCSNLVERLNRSYYYYLMVSSDRFVPVEVYMIPCVLLLLSILFKATDLRKRAPLNGDEQTGQLTCAVGFFLLVAWICLASVALTTLECLAKRDGSRDGGCRPSLVDITQLISFCLSASVAYGLYCGLCQTRSAISSFVAWLWTFSMCFIVVALVAVICANWCVAFIGAEAVGLLSLFVSLFHQRPSSLRFFIVCCLLLILSPPSLAIFPLMLADRRIDVWDLLPGSTMNGIVFWTVAYFPFWMTALLIAFKGR